MKLFVLCIAVLAGNFCLATTFAEEPNTLTPEEQQAGWKLLFNGRNTEGWRGYKAETLPGSWRVEGGSLLSRREQGVSSGDIVTKDQYGDFELTWEWKMTPGSNSGLIYRANEEKDAVWESGPEYQLLDNKTTVDGLNPLSSAGACYSVYAPAKDVTRPVGEWNRSRLLAVGTHIEHWMNGEKLLQYDVGSPDWNAHVKTSKFFQAAYKRSQWGQLSRGHIGLQDYGGAVEIRSLKIRELPRKE